MKLMIATHREDTTDKASWVFSSLGALTFATANPYCMAPPIQRVSIEINEYSNFLQIAPIYEILQFLQLISSGSGALSIAIF